MRILHITQRSLEFRGGVERQIYEVSSRLVKKGFLIEVVCGDGQTSINPVLVDGGIHINKLLSLRLLPLPYGLGVVVPLMLSVSLSIDADVVHAHSYGFPATWIGYFYKIFRNKPLVVSTHSDPRARIYPLFDLLRMIPVVKADKVIANTHLEMRHLVQLGVVPSYISLIPNGVTLSNRVIQMNRKDNLIFCLNRLDKRHKGQDILIRAIDYVRLEIPGIRLEIAGEGPDLYEFRRLVSELDLTKHVVFLGEIDEDTRRQKLMDCSVFCVSPRTESFSIVLLEAMSFGAPIVATNVGGIPEVIGDSGIMVPPEDPALLGAALVEVITNHYLAGELGRKGIERARKYNWDDIANEHARLYLDLFNQRAKETLDMCHEAKMDMRNPDETYGAGSDHLPLITVAVPARNASWSLEYLLTSLVRQTYPKNRTQVILVDDGSTDSTLAIFRKWAEIYYGHYSQINVAQTLEQNGSIPNARNICLRFANGDILIFCDSDTLPPERSIYHIVSKMMDRDKEIGIIGLPCDLRKPNLLGRIIRARERSNPRSFAKFVGFGFAALRHDVISRVGFFDERFLRGEDVDYCLRASKEGFRIVLDNTVRCIHLKRDNEIAAYQSSYWRLLRYCFFEEPSQIAIFISRGELFYLVKSVYYFITLSLIIGSFVDVTNHLLHILLSANIAFLISYSLSMTRGTSYGLIAAFAYLPAGIATSLGLLYYGLLRILAKLRTRLHSALRPHMHSNHSLSSYQAT